MTLPRSLKAQTLYENAGFCYFMEYQKPRDFCNRKEIAKPQCNCDAQLHFQEWAQRV